MPRILRARGIRGLILSSLPYVGSRLSLQWKHFACVTKGLTVHRVVSSHYEDMHPVLQELNRRRYRRVGLVLGEALSVRVDRAWLVSFLLHQHDVAEGDRGLPAADPRQGRRRRKFRCLEFGLVSKEPRIRIRTSERWRVVRDEQARCQCGVVVSGRISRCGGR